MSLLLDAHVRTVQEADFDWPAAECRGFFGYGNGSALADVAEHARLGGSNELPCHTCPIAQACWDEHRAKAAHLYPREVARFEELAAQHAGDVGAMLAAWRRDPLAGGQPLDPYLGLSMVNMQEAAGGATIAANVELVPE